MKIATVRWQVILCLMLAGLLAGCGSQASPATHATPQPAAFATLTPTPTVTVTPTPTSTASPTATPTLTATPSPSATPTLTPTLTSTPAPLIPSSTPTPEPSPTPALDFRIASWRLWPLALNSGCAKGMHTIFITVLDAEGKPLDGIIVGDTWNNVETSSGTKGLGKAEIDLWTNTMELTVKRNALTGELYTSESSFPFSSFMTTIPNDQMIQAGYCANDGDCDWKRANDSYHCGGHYSWEVIFQKTH
jgi:hypothetical protein